MALSKLSGDEQRILFTQLCNVLDPGLAVALSSANNELRTATEALLPQLRADHEAAAALCRKMGTQSCKELREAKKIEWGNRDLFALGSARRAFLRTRRPSSPRAAPCSSAYPACGPALWPPRDQPLAAAAPPASLPTGRGWRCSRPRRGADQAGCMPVRRCADADRPGERPSRPPAECPPRRLPASPAPHRVLWLPRLAALASPLPRRSCCCEFVISDMRRSDRVARRGSLGWERRDICAKGKEKKINFRDLVLVGRGRGGRKGVL